HLCLEKLDTLQADCELIDLQDLQLPNFDNRTIYQTSAYEELHQKIDHSDALVFASPVYNWGCFAELKKMVEAIGSTPPDKSVRGAFFDKVITFVNSAGLPHSYMAYTSLANSMMLDFKCIVSPYNLYVHNEQWDANGALVQAAQDRLNKSMKVLVELATLLKPRTYTSNWEI
ncbi:MAG: NAD(P)H-dependent oxidoreductase, partial [Verrucomicrobiota bacterium]